jgi:hypothetical protein
VVTANRRRGPGTSRTSASLTVDIAREPDAPGPIRAVVDRITAETVVVTCETGADALTVATSTRLSLTFRRPGLSLAIGARPGRRVDDIHGHRSVELVLEPPAPEVGLIR